MISRRREDTFEIQRRRNEIEAIAREEAMERMTRTAMLEARRRQREQAQEEALALEMERRKREEESRRREIQRICEADPGLRDLQSKLRMAYISKERGEQLQEKVIVSQAEKEAERALDAAMEAQRLKWVPLPLGVLLLLLLLLRCCPHRCRTSLCLSHSPSPPRPPYFVCRLLELEKVKAEEARRAAEERKRTVEQQLQEREIREFIEGEAEAQRERAMVDAILAKIRAEDEAEAASKARMREETVRMIDDFKAQRERAIEAQRAAEREEQARIAAYLATQGHRQEAAAKAKAEDAAIRDAQYRAIVAEQEALRKKQEEEDALRWLLVEEEAERRREEAERARIAASERSKREMMTANDEQKRIRERIAGEERAKEAALIKQFLLKCIEDDEKEQRARMVRAEARARYQAEIAEQRELKTALYQQQKLEEVKAFEEAQRREEFKRRVVEEARRKLLEEHAAILVSHCTIVCLCLSKHNAYCSLFRFLLCCSAVTCPAA